MSAEPVMYPHTPFESWDAFQLYSHWLAECYTALHGQSRGERYGSDVHHLIKRLQLERIAPWKLTPQILSVGLDEGLGWLKGQPVPDVWFGVTQ